VASSTRSRNSELGSLYISLSCQFQVGDPLALLVSVSTYPSSIVGHYSDSRVCVGVWRRARSVVTVSMWSMRDAECMCSTSYSTSLTGPCHTCQLALSRAEG